MDHLVLLYIDMMYLYDFHTHHAAEELEGGYKVKSILNTFPENYLSTKDRYTGGLFSCGVHPWYSENAEERLEILKAIAADEQIVFVGEIGLDKSKGPDLQTQVEVFKAQIKLAESLRKPLVIHCVKAWDELIALYKEYQTSVPWVIHGYRGNVEQTKRLSRLGFKFSIGAKFNEESVKQMPLDSIFCETDESNVSICKVYERLLGVLGLDFDLFAKIMDENISFLLK